MAESTLAVTLGAPAALVVEPVVPAAGVAEEGVAVLDATAGVVVPLFACTIGFETGIAVAGATELFVVESTLGADVPADPATDAIAVPGIAFCTAVAAGAPGVAEEPEPPCVTVTDNGALLAVELAGAVFAA